MADLFLVGNQQLAAKLESVAGTFETLSSSEVKLKPFRTDSDFAPDVLRFSNEEVSEDGAEAADFPAGDKGSIQVGVVLKTSGTVGTTPAIGPYLRACGLQEEIVHAITIGAPSGGDGIFEEGAAYSATGGKTGIIELEITGAGTLRYVATTGGALADTDVVTVGSDSATCSGADALYAVKYRPRSTGFETISIQRALKNDAGTAAQDYLHKLRGACGTGTITAEALNTLRLALEFQGVIESNGAGSFFTGVTYESGTPPQFQNSTVQLDGVARQVNTVTIDLGNDLQMEPDPTTTGGTAGYDFCRIALPRTPTISIDPYLLKPGTTDILADLKDGSIVAFTMTLGTTPQVIEFKANYCQVRGWSSGERAGRRTEELELAITRHATITDWDWHLYLR